jgi:hypothetical protein
MCCTPKDTGQRKNPGYILYWYHYSYLCTRYTVPVESSNTVVQVYVLYGNFCIQYIHCLPRERYEERWVSGCRSARVSATTTATTTQQTKKIFGYGAIVMYSVLVYISSDDPYKFVM